MLFIAYALWASERTSRQKSLAAITKIDYGAFMKADFSFVYKITVF